MTRQPTAAAAGTIDIGGDLTVNRMGYGAMRITGNGIWHEPPDRERAKAALRRAVELAPESTEMLCWLAVGCAASGNHTEARAILERLLSSRPDTYVSPYDLGLVHLSLGETDQALGLFAKAYRERASVYYLNVEPAVEGIRSHPRFQALLRQMRFIN